MQMEVASKSEIVNSWKKREQDGSFTNTVRAGRGREYWVVERIQAAEDEYPACQPDDSFYSDRKAFVDQAST